MHDSNNKNTIHHLEDWDFTQAIESGRPGHGLAYQGKRTLLNKTICKGLNYEI
jgi:hypothetical protein